MILTIDTSKDTHADLRAAAFMLLHIVGDLDEPKVPTLTVTEDSAGKIEAKMPIVDVATGKTSTIVVKEIGDNVVNFPPPQSATSGPPAANTFPQVTVAPIALNTVSVPPDYDVAGMPWDSRIHGQKRAKKQNGTWKLQRGIDPAFVESVVKDLHSRGLIKSAVPEGTTIHLNKSGTEAIPPPTLTQDAMARIAALQPPATVILPPESNTVPLPPPPSDAAAAGVPPPPVTASVSIPPPPADGSVSPFKELMDALTAATRAGKITPAQVNLTVQQAGAPNLPALREMPDLIPLVRMTLGV